MKEEGLDILVKNEKNEEGVKRSIKPRSKKLSVRFYFVVFATRPDK